MRDTRADFPLIPPVTPETGMMERAQEASRPGAREPGGMVTADPPGIVPGPLGPASRRTSLLALLDRPLASYYLILGITTLLVALGLVMVLSTSSVANLDQGGSPYSGFQHQLLGVALGLPCMWLAARCSPTMFRAAAYPLMFVSILGLLLTPLIGHKSGGAIRYIPVGPLAFQASELAKLAF